MTFLRVQAQDVQSFMQLGIACVPEYGLPIVFQDLKYIVVFKKSQYCFPAAQITTKRAKYHVVSCQYLVNDKVTYLCLFRGKSDQMLLGKNHS